MANMSYCKFENTLRDLRDCAASMDDDEELSQTESDAKDALIELCRDIIDTEEENY
jgi:hypothetical protein